MRKTVYSVAAILAASSSSIALNHHERVRTTDPSGCVLEQVAAAPNLHQFQVNSVTPDSSGIAIGWENSEKERGTYLLDVATGKRTALPGLNNGATFSPDGKHMVAAIYVPEGKTDIVLVDRASGERTIIAKHEAWEWLPNFSPDSSKLLFNSRRTGNSDIYLYSLESGLLKQITTSSNYEAHAQFSPDGEFLLYHEHMGDGDFNINLMELATRDITVLRPGPREESYASWSPDGRYIAFASDKDQKPTITDLYIMDRAGTIVERITDMAAKDAYPFWSPDGAYLYFNSDREPKGVYRAAMTDIFKCKRS